MDYQKNKLVRDNRKLRDQIQKLRNQVRIGQQQLVVIDQQRTRYLHQLQQANIYIEKFNTVLQKRQGEVRQKQRIKHQQNIYNIDSLKQQNKRLNFLNKDLSKELSAKQNQIAQIKNILTQCSRKYKFPMPKFQSNVSFEDSLNTQSKLINLTQKYNRISENYDNLVAQNKVLRKLSGVPQNYGFDLQQIKHAQKQETSDLRRKIRILENQIQQLQQERTQLRFKIKNIVGTRRGESQRYSDLSQQQLQLLDQIAIQIKSGTYYKKSYIKHSGTQTLKLSQQNKMLRAMLQENRREQGYSTLKQRKGYEQIRRYQQQLKKLIIQGQQKQRRRQESEDRDEIESIQLHTKIYKDSQKNSDKIDKQRQFKQQQTFRTYLHRQKQKKNIQQRLILNLIDQTQINLPSQLPTDPKQLTQLTKKLLAQQFVLFRTNQNLSESLQAFNQNLSRLKIHHQTIVQQRDAILLQSKRLKQDYNIKISQAFNQKRLAQIGNTQSMTRVKSLEQSLRSMSKGNVDKKEIADLSNRIALSQGQVVRLSKQCQFYKKTVEFKQKILQEFKHNHTTQIHLIKQKYIRLRGLYNKSITQNQALLNVAKQSISYTQHKKVQQQLAAKKGKLSLAQLKQIQLRSQLCQNQTYQRQLRFKMEQLDVVLQQNADLQLQNALLGHRLEALDACYQKYSNLIKRLAHTLNIKGVSPTSFFAQNTSQTKQLKRRDIQDAFADIGMISSKQELDNFMMFMDLNNSGSIDLRQFMGKMRRAGVMIRNKGQQAIIKVSGVMRQMNYSLKDCFKAIDSKERGQITLVDINSFFNDVGQKVNKKDIEFIFKLANKEGRGMNYQDFCNVFSGGMNKIQIKDELLYKNELNWKDKILLNIHDAIKNQGLQPAVLFQKFDINHDKRITKYEFQQLLNSINVSITRAQSQDLFLFIDKSNSGYLDYGRFIKIFQDAIRQSRLIQRQMQIYKRARQIGQLDSQMMRPVKQSQSSKNEIKASILQMKLKHCNKKLEGLSQQISRKQVQLRQLNERIQSRDVQIIRVSEQFFIQKQKNRQLQGRLRNYHSQQQIQRIKKQNISIKTQLQQTRQSSQVNKRLCINIAHLQSVNKSYIQRLNDQINKYKALLKPLQKDQANQKNIQLEKINIQNKQIIASLKQSADHRQQDSLFLKNQNLKMQQKIQSLLQQLNQTTIAFITLKQTHNKYKQNYQNPQLITHDRLQNTLTRIRQISQQKIKTQASLRTLQQKYFQIQLRNNFLQMQKQKVQYLESTLSTKSRSEISDQLIDQANKLSTLRLQQLKARRQASTAIQRQAHTSRLLQVNKHHLQIIQIQLSQWQTKLQRRQQFWRKKLAHSKIQQRKIQYQQPKLRYQQRIQNPISAPPPIPLGSGSPALKSLRYSREYQNSLQFRQLASTGVRQLQSRSVSPVRMQSQQSRIVDTQELDYLRRQIDELKNQLERSRIKQSKKGKRTVGYQAQFQKVQVKQLQTKNAYLISQQQKLKQLNKQNVKIREAAQQSISMLQRMIDDKNQQIDKKDRIIDNLREQINLQRKRSDYEIQKLSQKVSELATQLSRKRIDMPQKQLINTIPTSLQRTHSRGTKLFKAVDKQLKGTMNISYKIKGQNDELYRKNKQLMKQNELLSRKLKNMQRNTNEIETLKKLLIQKQKDIKSLNGSIEQIKRKLCNEIQKQQRQQISIREKVVSRSNNDASMQTQLQRAIIQINKLKKQNKQLKQQIQKYKSIKIK